MPTRTDTTPADRLPRHSRRDPGFATRSYGLNVLYCIVGLIVCLVVMEATSIDLFVERLLYDNTTHTWLLSKNQAFARVAFYDGPKVILIASFLVLVAALAVGRWSARVRDHVPGIRIVVLSLLLVPGAVAALKQTNEVACPNDLTMFGGDVPYTALIDAVPRPKPEPPHRPCFPAAHASGGFALISLVALFGSPRNRRRVLAAAIATGWLMGGYKMLIGDHFLSHTVVSMCLAGLIVNLLLLIDAALASIKLAYRYGNPATAASPV